ncbi:MAG: TonB family protein [Sandaracinaceae bacterium]|nr:TonB family protein [Sandaracinaceae bacterium]
MTPRSALPPLVVLLIALGVSAAMHVPVYVGLGILSKLLDREVPDLPHPQPIEVEFVDSDEPEAVTEAPEPTEEAPDEEPDPDWEEPETPAAEELAAAPPRLEPEPAPTPNVLPTPPAVTPPPPPPPRENLTSVEHRSRDPNVEPPPDAQHLAEENSRVEEETQARIRNPNLNDEVPQPAAEREPSTEPEEGDSSDEREAQLQDAEGSDERDPTPEEVRQPPRPPTPRPSVSPTPSVAEAAQGDRRQGGSADPAPPRQAPSGGARSQGGGEEVATQDIVVDDGNGRFTIRVRTRPQGTGEGAEGGPAVEGSGRGTSGDGALAGRAGRGRARARGGSAPGRGAPNLRLSWSDFATIYGEDELQRERDLALAQRQSRTRGANRQRHWEQFRAAIENYDVRVRPGTQTALNTRADPFARYIAAMHRRIHQRFALSYLMRVPEGVDETFRTNQDMNTNLEIGIDAEGRVEHVSVISTSGNTLFDLGAFEAVMGAQPFPEPPSSIRSPDGLVYLHWAFFRNERQCGTFNARAFILAQAPRRRGDDVAPTPTPAPPPRPEE